MGMFDRLSDLRLRCVYCGEAAHLEIQTKEIEAHPQLAQYSVHYLGRCSCAGPFKAFMLPHALVEQERFRTVSAIVSCGSPPCAAFSQMHSFVNYGYTSGGGRAFDVRYRVVKGMVTGPAEVTNRHQPGGYRVMKRQFLQALHRQSRAWKSFQRQLVQREGEFGLAVLCWHFSSLPSRGKSRGQS